MIGASLSVSWWASQALERENRTILKIAVIGLDGSQVANAVTMSFATLVDRVRYEFMEMPGMELTLAQAGRLWNMGADDCRFVIDALVDAGFLRWTTQRTIIRTGRA